MRWWSLCLGMVGVICAGCTAGGSLADDPAHPPAQASRYRLPEEFAAVQGASGWFYHQAAPESAASQPLAWGAAPAEAGHGITDCWRDAANPAALIARHKLHPVAGADAVIAWRAPRAGPAELTVTVSCLDADPEGDGAALTFWHNAARVSEPALLANQLGQTHALTCARTLRAGDTFCLRLHAGADDAADWFSYAVEIRLP
ncbi:MAG TPA: hypothetical protein PLZ36_13665 [Armatimonadota bacterium]|nr:hypothetical protein [Armatimonadota bacterium]